MTDKEVLTEKDDVEMMQRPHLWTWPALPLKRSNPNGPGIETALLYDTETGEMHVAIGANLFGTWLKTSVKIYKNAQAVYDDGWRVD